MYQAGSNAFQWSDASALEVEMEKMATPTQSEGDYFGVTCRSVKWPTH